MIGHVCHMQFSKRDGERLSVARLPTMSCLRSREGRGESCNESSSSPCRSHASTAVHHCLAALCI
jgi:hypothetical protein